MDRGTFGTAMVGDAPSTMDRGTAGRRPRPRRRPSLPFPPPALLAALLVGVARVDAQGGGGRVCSCSPLEFLFRLDLTASCPALPPPFPPNGVFGAGVQDYTCTVGPEPVPGIEQEVDAEDGARRRAGREPVRRRQREEGRRRLQGTAADFFPELFLNPPSYSSENFTASQVDDGFVENPLVDDVVPVSVYSVQFIEVDTGFNVINQDSAYVRDIDFTTGQLFNYTSISARDPDRVPGGMNMVLRGVNRFGEPVRNVFTVTYTNSCDVATFARGESIGWVTLENFAPASADTCDAPIVTTAPTSRPTPTPPPITPFPTVGPPEPGFPTTDEPTGGPTARPSPTPPPVSPFPTEDPTGRPTRAPTGRPGEEPTNDPAPVPTTPEPAPNTQGPAPRPTPGTAAPTRGGTLQPNTPFPTPTFPLNPATSFPTESPAGDPPGPDGPTARPSPPGPDGPTTPPTRYGATTGPTRRPSGGDDTPGPTREPSGAAPPPGGKSAKSKTTKESKSKSSKTAKSSKFFKSSKSAKFFKSSKSSKSSDDVLSVHNKSSKSINFSKSAKSKSSKSAKSKGGKSREGDSYRSSYDGQAPPARALRGRRAGPRGTDARGHPRR